MINLFQKKRFKMHSGGYSDFKVECDALNETGYDTLAFMVSRNMKYGKVYGIPRGGVPFGNALEKYSTTGHDTVLIADDVLTTGKSMEEAKKRFQNQSSDIKGIVVFARGKLSSWIDQGYRIRNNKV